MTGQNIDEVGLMKSTNDIDLVRIGFYILAVSAGQAGLGVVDGTGVAAVTIELGSLDELSICKHGSNNIVVISSSSSEERPI